MITASGGLEIPQSNIGSVQRATRAESRLLTTMVVIVRWVDNGPCWSGVHPDITAASGIQVLARLVRSRRDEA